MASCLKSNGFTVFFITTNGACCPVFFEGEIIVFDHKNKCFMVLPFNSTVRFLFSCVTCRNGWIQWPDCSCLPMKSRQRLHERTRRVKRERGKRFLSYVLIMASTSGMSTVISCMVLYYVEKSIGRKRNVDV